MKILIVGANGFLGKKLTAYFSKNNEVIPAGINLSDNLIKLDATNEVEVDNIITKLKPDVVIDTVALSNSVECEKNPNLCKKLNYATAKNIAKSCNKNNSLMVFISSSYVFDGNKGDYKEDDSVSPMNQYATTKIMAEEEVSKLPKFLIIRVDMIFGVDTGSIRFGTGNFNKDSVEVGYPNQLRSPIFVDDIPKIIDMLIKNKKNGIFHLATKGKVKLLTFLKELSKIENAEDKIRLVDSSKWIVKSPENSTLNTSKINSLGIKITSIKEALKKIESQI